MVDTSGKEKDWLTLHFHTNGAIKKPNEIEDLLFDPPNNINLDNETMNRILGSMFGLGLGDALGASTEFRPHQYMVANPVKTLLSGGTWGLERGQFTDDTSMSLCLGNSLVAKRGFVLYDQLVRYKWWFRHGYMSSTGHCFDIGAATRRSIQVFEEHQQKFLDKHNITSAEIDFLSDPNLLNKFDVYCSEDGVAGNGALMRLAPVPLFFYRDPVLAVEYSGQSAKITHGDQKAIDACRYYGALIAAAVRGESRGELLDKDFYKKNVNWFNGKPLHPDIENIAKGSFKKEGGYDEGIRGKGYVVDALKAALWAFWQDNESFEKGVLAAVNLGDDTDTTAAIYGQLAGACYGYDKLPKEWRKELYAKEYIKCLCNWIGYEGEMWHRQNGDDQNKSQNKRGNNSHLSPNSAENGHHRRLRSNTHTEVRLPNQVEAHPQQSINRNRSSSAHSQASKTPIFIHPAKNATQDVCDWLETLDREYKKYWHEFLKHGIDAYWLLNHVVDKNLQELGITNQNDRKRILEAIEKLKSECPKRYAAKDI